MEETKQIDDGRPAFPLAQTHQTSTVEDGMTLRQWYAGQAMQKVEVGLYINVNGEDVKLIGSPHVNVYKMAVREQVRAAFAYADMMIDEGKRKS